MLHSYRPRLQMLFFFVWLSNFLLIGFDRHRGHGGDFHRSNDTLDIVHFGIAWELVVDGYMHHTTTKRFELPGRECMHCFSQCVLFKSFGCFPVGPPKFAILFGLFKPGQARDEVNHLLLRHSLLLLGTARRQHVLGERSGLELLIDHLNACFLVGMCPCG